MITIKNTDAEDYGTHYSFILAGETGAQLSKFAASAPNPLIINASGNLASLAGNHVKQVKFDSIDELIEIKMQLEDNYTEFFGVDKIDTVIIDTMDEVSRILVDERLTKNRLDTMGGSDWSWLGDQLHAIVEAFKRLPMHVIFVTHIKDQSDDYYGTFWKLDISGAGAHQMPESTMVNLLLRDEWNLEPEPVEEMGKVTPERKRIKTKMVYSESIPGFGWLKDLTGTLEPSFEAGSFQDIIQPMQDKYFTLSHSEVLTREIEEEETPTPPTPKPKSNVSAKPSTKVTKSNRSNSAAADEIAARMAAGDAIVAEARAVKPGTVDPKPKVTAKSSDEEYPDLTGLDDGTRFDIQNISESTPNGLQINSKGRAVQIRGVRWLYREGGDQIVSLNQLPKGIRPKLDGKVNSGLFCTVTGQEITPEEAAESRARAGYVLCRDEFAKLIN